MTSRILHRLYSLVVSFNSIGNKEYESNSLFDGRLTPAKSANVANKSN